jgi:two-component system, cell cycle response regulator CtrA
MLAGRTGIASEVEELRRENFRLQTRVRDLEQALRTPFIAPSEWKLTPTEERVFEVLMARQVATRRAIMVAVYTNVLRDEPNEKILDVWISKIRSKLRPFAIRIETHHGVGWSISPETRAHVLAARAREPKRPLP